MSKRYLLLIALLVLSAAGTVLLHGCGTTDSTSTDTTWKATNS